MCLVLQSRIYQESWILIAYDYAWKAFKRDTVVLEDQTMQDQYQIYCLIDFAVDNPYALEIRYHHKCWLKYVRN